MRNGESPVTTRRRFVAVEKATNFRTAILSGRWAAILPIGAMDCRAAFCSN